MTATPFERTIFLDTDTYVLDDLSGVFSLLDRLMSQPLSDLVQSIPVPDAVREERRARFMAVAEEVSVQRLRRRIGATMQVLVDSAPAMGRKGGLGRSYADAPEIDGTVKLLPPEKLSKTLKVGEFTRARIVDAQGHDLVAVPI